MVEFSNDPIDLSGVPQLDDDAFVPMHPNYLRVSLIGRGLFAAIVVIIAVVVAVLLPEGRWIPLAVAGAILLLTAIGVALKVVEVRHIAYQVREHDLSYRSGVLVKTVQSVPFVRVQHAKINHGPIQRMFDLASVSVSSAGPDLHIHGLGHDDAERLKSLVVERAGALDEEL